MCFRRGIMRSFICILVLAIYVALFNIYLYQLVNPDWSMKIVKLFYNYLTLSMLIFCLWDTKLGFENEYHEQFNWMCWGCLIINYILIILTHHTILVNCFRMFICFNGSVFATSLMIFISAKRHGLFKN